MDGNDGSRWIEDKCGVRGHVAHRVSYMPANINSDR
jgi:hypothetical protein